MMTRRIGRVGMLLAAAGLFLTTENADAFGRRNGSDGGYGSAGGSFGNGGSYGGNGSWGSNGGRGSRGGLFARHRRGGGSDGGYGSNGGYASNGGCGSCGGTYNAQPEPYTAEYHNDAEYRNGQYPNDPPAAPVIDSDAEIGSEPPSISAPPTTELDSSSGQAESAASDRADSQAQEGPNSSQNTGSSEDDRGI